MIKSILFTFGLLFSTYFIIVNQNLFVISAILIFLIFILLINPKFNIRINYLITLSLMIIVFHLLFNRGDFYTKITKGVTASFTVVSLSLSVFIYSSFISLSKFTKLLFFLPSYFKFALTITFSQIPNVFWELDKITKVQKSRGLNQKVFLSRKSLPIVIVPLLHRMLTRGEHISISMICRAYE